ncbi:MAG: hypothetical protein KKG09_04570 [Verrucomicrobia bacterium]|nr:hypothetical protein [Verrucomicrobiota bacterium]MBU4289445.1 hypothetical protein [Verrucomicrobiota bacterium]MBU4428715.1 hypothetical protein [Verrucomicrobiota bacterium]MBU4497259.1 hypothetical protein [Verrucomicrobiota bacterium]MCG2679152.1 hypothetical protein [Kiritimatiellia bacterium]
MAATNKDLVDCLLKQGVRVVAVTDHHKIDVPRVRSLQLAGADAITVLPGIELRSELGGKELIHYIAVFPEDCDLNDVWTKLSAKLGITEADVQGKGEDDICCDLADSAKVIHELHGIVVIHGHGKAGSIEGIANAPAYKAMLKADLLRDHVDMLEIGNEDRQKDYRDIVFPAINHELPLVVCSDNHDIRNYTPRASCWIRADPTFRGLLMTLREPRDRVFVGDQPPDMARVAQNGTKYVRGISFQRRDGLSPSEKWFSGTVSFNPGLVAIIGNKGSGKSALSDILGLLGATKNAGAFSFLDKDRFRHSGCGRAGFFDVTMEWASGEKVKRWLNEDPKPEDVERVQYLPQDHVEKICNEIVGTGEEGFEQELKSVIFSHVPETKRLGNATLDELVGFQAGEKQKRIDSLLKQLKDSSRRRASLEAQADPTAKRALEEKIKRREIELEAHDKGKPKEIPNPATSPESAVPDRAILTALSTAESTKKTLLEKIVTTTNILRSAERQQAVAKRLLEKLDNFQKDFDVFRKTLEGDAKELGLQVSDLVALSIERGAIESSRDAATKVLETAKTQLDGDDPPGLRTQLATMEAEVTNLQSRLDARNREYQTYLASLREWQEKRTTLEGSESDPESIKGLQCMLSQMADLPREIVATKREQSKLALDIHAAKIAQSAVYRDLYGAVQNYIDTHVIAKDKLKLEFRVELVCERFADRLMSALALNRRGSFMGVDEGRSRADVLVQSTNWKDEASVRRFLRRVDLALHKDQRERPSSRTQLKDQLPKGKKPEEVFDLLYGLEYIRPKYILRWENKDISMLSAGERGTLLLVFYLLVDQGDVPLIIDQPEGNLDNHTVARVLVDCIKEARRKRQVFIVTHNPNLAVVCDADQVVHAAMDKTSGNAITYTTGSLENPAMSKCITDVLEGTRWAFDVRDSKYKVSEW